MRNYFKRVASIILATLILLTAMQISAFATDGAECRIVLDSDGSAVTDLGDTLSAETLTLNDAFEWVYGRENSEDYTVYLLKDVSTAKQFLPTSFDADNVRTVKINGIRSDGKNYSLTSSVAGGIFGGLGIYNLTISNVDLISSNGDSMEWMPKTTAGNVDISGLSADAVFNTWFENCTLNAGEKAAGTLKVQAGANLTAPVKAKFHVTLKDCVFNCNNGVSQFYVLRGPNLQLDIVGSQMNKIAATAGDGRFTTFLSTENGASVELNVRNSEKNTSVINISPNVAKAGGLLYDHSYKAGTHRITFEKDTKVIFGNTQAQEQYFVSSSDADHITVIDMGASFVLTKAALAAGARLTLPAISDEFGDGKAWYKDGEAYSGTSYSNTSATSDVIFTAVSTAVDDPECHVTNSEGNRVTDFNTEASARNLTISQAFAWVYSCEDSEKYEIKLLKDVTVGAALAPSVAYDAGNVKTVKIDGGGHKLTATQKAGIFCNLGLYNLYVSDLHMISSNGDSLDWTFADNGRSGVPEGFEHFTAYFENCTLTPADGAGAGTVKIHGKNLATSVYEVTFKDCILNATNSVSQFFILGKPNLTLNVIGTTLNSRGGASGDVRFGYMFASSDGSNVKVNVSNSDTNASVLNESLGVSRESGIVADFNNSGVFELDLDKGVSVIFNTPYAVSQSVISPDDLSRVTVNDNGAIFIAGKEALSAGATVDLNTGNVSWIKNGNGAFYGNSYSDKSATDDVIFTRLGYFATVTGAAVRLSEPSGIRFTAEFCDELINDANVTVGMLVTTYNPNVPLTSENFTHEGLTSMGLKYIDQEGTEGKYGEENEITVLRVALTGIPENAIAYETLFAARAYVKIGDTYCYADFDGELNTRSLYQVAKILVETDKYKDNEYILAIIDTVENSEVSN